MYYLYLVENRMAEQGIEGTILRTEEAIRKCCVKCYRFLSAYCLKSDTNRWGKTYEEGYRKQKQGAKIDKCKPLIEQLTNVFTRAQLEELIEKNQLDTEARFYVAKWKAKGWIVKLRKNVYQKQL